VAMQSLLFGHPELAFFGDDIQRAELVSYIGGLGELAAWLGAGVMVLGSPGNRRRGDISQSAAMAMAIDTFGILGARMAALGVCLCIEPNPPDYGCDFVTTAAEGRSIVEAVDSPGFGLHLDTAAMTLSGDDLAGEIGRSVRVLRHFHISDPSLALIGTTGRVDHDAAAGELRRVAYEGWTSVEMLPADGGDAAVRDAAAFATRTYG
jgi:D-psicose/D-tagatose/L-ribulose 3-epimerase